MTLKAYGIIVLALAVLAVLAVLVVIFKRRINGWFERKNKWKQ